MAKKKKEGEPEIRFTILTLFPDMFEGPFSESIIGRAVEEELIDINLVDIRDYAEDKNEVDDKPYGGGPGMVLKPEPIFKAHEAVMEEYYDNHSEKDITHTILLTPKGRRYNYRITGKVAGIQHIILICGHYEGVDHRVFEHLADEQLSVGDYVLTGGEIPAMIIVDSVSRQIDGVLGKDRSRQDETFEYTDQGLLKPPLYTRPEEFRDYKVPDILLSGNHQEIEQWQKDEAKKLTKEYRPDILKRPSGYF